MLAFRLLWRNWRSGELKILAAALTLAVAVVSAISIFTFRLEAALVKESASFLGGDRVVSSSQPFPPEWQQQADQSSIKTTSATEFMSMVFAGDNMNLASVKAVAPNYPLLGSVDLSETAFAVDAAQISPSQAIPQSGTAWVDSRLLPLLQIELGETVQVGDKDLVVTHVIIHEPDRGGGLTMVSPRLMMNQADVPATNVVQPGSRVSYRWMLAGNQSDIEDFTDWLEPLLTDHQRLLDLESSQQQLSSALGRGSRFLLLAGIVGVLLAGVAIAMASQRFAARHVDQVALMKSLGTPANKIRILYFSQLTYLAIVASLIGIVVGQVVQQVIVTLLSGLFPVALGGAPAEAYIFGLLTGIVCLLFFALPPLWQLPTIPPIKILRREMTVSLTRSSAQAGLGVLAILLLILFYSGDIFLAASVFSSLAMITLFLGVIATLLLKAGQKVGRQAGSIWRLAFSSLQRNRVQTIIQTMVFATAILLLLAMISTRTSLIDEWEAALPEDAPNHVFLNIASYEREPINEIVVKEGFEPLNYSPMLRMRLTKINGETPTDETREENGVLRRELMVSWRDDLPADNEITDGEWWPLEASTETADELGGISENGENKSEENTLPVLGGVSAENRVAKQLDLEIGDVLTFSVGGLEFNLRVDSFRSVNRDSFEWYIFLAEPGVLDNYQPTYRADILLTKDQKLLVNDILLAHPTVVVFEFDKIIEQIRSIVTQVTRGVELVLWLVLSAGAMVLLAAVNASMEQRLQEAGLLRALGSSRRLILGTTWAEFSLLGFLAGLLAIPGVEVLLGGLQTWVFDMPVKLHPELWIGGLLVGTLLVGVLGVLSCRKVVTAAPAAVLRELEG